MGEGVNKITNTNTAVPGGVYVSYAHMTMRVVKPRVHCDSVRPTAG